MGKIPVLMFVVMAAVVMAPLVIGVGMSGAEMLHVGTMAPMMPMMVIIVIAIAIADGDIADVEPDSDGGMRAGNSQ